MLTKLKSAVKSRNELLVQQILQEDKPSLNSQEGGEILWHAVLDGEIEIASMLVQAEADLSARQPGCILKKSFLHVLAGSLDPRDHRLAVLMLDYGADINVHDVYTNGVLHYAIQAHNSAVGFIEKLVNRGCRVTHDVIATVIEHPLASKLLPQLIMAGHADDDVRYERVVMALQRLSYYHGNESEILPVVKILLDMKIPIEKSSNIHILFNAIQTNKIQMVKLLIAHDVFNMAVKCKNGTSALHTACMAVPSIDIFKLLVLHGADFNAVDSNGSTPFFLLCPGCENEIIQFVIKQLTISKAKGFTVNQMDLNRINCSAEMTIFYERCQKELNLMKMTTVLNDITLFSILSNGLKHLTFLIRNDKFAKSYEDSSRKSDFPIFYDELQYMFKAAEERKKMLLQKEEALCEVLKTSLPHLPVETIIYNLYMNEN